MKKSLLFLGLLAAFMGASHLYAANVSFLVLEAGRAGPYGSQYPSLWENGLLEIFFDSGHIVSNSPIIQLAEKPDGGFPHEAEKDYELAKEGGMDFFIVTIVDYGQADVSLRLFSTQSQNMIREQTYSVRTFRNTKEEYESIKAAVSAMAAYLNEEG